MDLQEHGIDYADGVARFSGNAASYEKFLKKFITDPEFSKLCTAMEQKNFEVAFYCAHTLKGMCGNLSMQRLYEKIKLLVEMLRNQTDLEKAQAYFPEIRAEYDAVIRILKEYFNAV